MTMVEAVVHPVTGELVDAGEETLARVDRETRDEIGRLYRGLQPVKERLAELRGPVRLPPRRFQTDTQMKVCPKCGIRWEPGEEET